MYHFSSSPHTLNVFRYATALNSFDIMKYICMNNNNSNRGKKFKVASRRTALNFCFYLNANQQANSLPKFTTCWTFDLFQSIFFAVDAFYPPRAVQLSSITPEHTSSFRHQWNIQRWIGLCVNSLQSPFGYDLYLFSKFFRSFVHIVVKWKKKLQNTNHICWLK